MIELLRAAYVIARRDYVATVWSKTFLLFLLGPLFPIVFGAVFGAIGANVDRDVAHPRVAILAEGPDAEALGDAHARLSARLGRDVLPRLSFVQPKRDAAAQAASLLADQSRGIGAVLSSPFGSPLISGPRSLVDGVDGGIALLLDEVRQHRALQSAGDLPAPVIIRRHAVEQSAGNAAAGGLFTARVGQLLLLMLTMILAGMLLSNLIEEKSNKVIEVLAAAVPVDAIFLGKLLGMLAMSLTGIAVWGSVGALGLALILPPGNVLPSPAVGWSAFLVLGVVYFTSSYLLLGALFLGIGAQASSAREVQTLSMPITMGQLVVFAFASAAVGRPDGGVGIAASLFPFSSPFAMFARAAQEADLWPHLLAVAWQGLWVAIIIRVTARRFRLDVLKSGRGGRGLFGRRRRTA